MKRRHLNIKGKLLVLFFVLAAVPMVAVGVASYFNSVRSVESMVERRSLTTVQELVGDVMRQLEPRRNEVKLLARNQEIQDLYDRVATEGFEAVGTVEPKMPPRLQAFFRQFFSGPREVYAQVYYLNAEGELIFKYARGAGGGFGLERHSFATADPDFPGMDLTSFESEKALFLSNEYGSAYGPVIRMGRWIRDVDDGNRIGFVSADLEVGRLLQETRLSQISGANGTLIIAEGDHDRVFFHPQGVMIGWDLAQVLPGFAQAYSRMKGGEEGWERYREGKEEWLASYVRIQDLNWTVAMLSLPSAFTGAIHRAGIVNLLITFSSVLLMVALVVFIVGRITGSIRQVTRGAEAISNGRLDQEIAVRSRDETRTLAEAFNRMASNLRRTMGDLRQLNEELEDRVRRRTAELEKANREIQEANRAKSEFLANMSHELRTPMNSILGFTELMKDGIFGEISESFQEPLDEIHKSGDHLLELINDVLDLSKIEAGRMELHPSECAIEGCVESVASTIRPLAEEKGLKVVTSVEEGLPTCTVDEGRITQVLLNLAGNAVKFTEEGEVEIGVRRQEEDLLLWVRDTGIGVPLEKLEEIFTEFSQAGTLLAREQEGTGLGLSISKRIVEMHGGEIGVESKVGKGSTFWFRIPMEVQI